MDPLTLISLGSTLFNGLSGLNSSNKANKLAKQQYAAGAPYREAGAVALKNLQDPNAYQASDNFKNQVEQGTQGVLGSAALGGSLNSGPAAMALSEFVRKQALGDRAQYQNEQLGIANLGLNGNASSVATAGQPQAAAMSGNQTQNDAIGGILGGLSDFVARLRSPGSSFQPVQQDTTASSFTPAPAPISGTGFVANKQPAAATMYGTAGFNPFKRI
jgi:hypothetical protein